MSHTLPDEQTMYEALVAKDSSFDGLFIAAIKSTGIFCRPTCTARKPKQENVVFYASPREALLDGFRPCKLCKPMALPGETPEWLNPLIREIEDQPDLRLTDQDLRDRNLDPNRVRRWFKKYHGMTFQSYMRTRRISEAFGRIKLGDNVVKAAFESGYESLSGFTESFKKTTGFSPVRSMDNQMIVFTRITTPLGPMLAGVANDALCLLEFVDRRMIETQLSRLRKIFDAELMPGSHFLFEQVKQELDAYFEGTLREFHIPLELKGTPFQEKVWRVLLTIPYSKTRSYKEQAELIGNPSAVRAVARANGDNRIAILVPCHRVIGADGKLTGYGGGLWRKQYLLDLESSQQKLL